MGTVIDFRPVLRTGRAARSIACTSESATVIILPVIRIERYADEPDDSIRARAEQQSRASPPPPRQPLLVNPLPGLLRTAARRGERGARHRHQIRPRGPAPGSRSSPCRRRFDDQPVSRVTSSFSGSSPRCSRCHQIEFDDAPAGRAIVDGVVGDAARACRTTPRYRLG